MSAPTPPASARTTKTSTMAPSRDDEKALFREAALARLAELRSPRSLAGAARARRRAR
jgi:hypothetical protein